MVRFWTVLSSVRYAAFACIAEALPRSRKYSTGVDLGVMDAPMKKYLLLHARHTSSTGVPHPQLWRNVVHAIATAVDLTETSEKALAVHRLL